MISLKKAKKSERVEAVVMNAYAPVSKADIAEKLPDVSIKTIELALSKLQKAGKIKKTGSYRDARYRSNISPGARLCVNKEMKERERSLPEVCRYDPPDCPAGT